MPQISIFPYISFSTCRYWYLRAFCCDVSFPVLITHTQTPPASSSVEPHPLLHLFCMFCGRHVQVSGAHFLNWDSHSWQMTDSHHHISPSFLRRLGHGHLCFSASWQPPHCFPPRNGASTASGITTDRNAQASSEKALFFCHICSKATAQTETKHSTEGPGRSEVGVELVRLFTGKEQKSFYANTHCLHPLRN